MRAVVGAVVLLFGCSSPEAEGLFWTGPGPAPMPAIEDPATSSSTSSGEASSTASAGGHAGAGGEGGAGGQGGDGASATSSSSTGGDVSAGGAAGVGGAGGAGGGTPEPECLRAEDCPGRDGPCARRTCSDGACGLQLTAAGTPLSAQTAGDCIEQRCDGRGGQEAAPAPADVADDGNACTADACGPAGPTHEAIATGTTCSGGLCQSGACVPYITVRCTTPEGIFEDCDGFQDRSYVIRWLNDDGSYGGCLSHGPGYCPSGTWCRVRRSNGMTVEGTCL
ncbi:hypothetical protein WMF20_35345 [Sorangium sp. So ce834]|uniref:hypothetical protein n=1 Tax=Sorangium sp. So ce834 TaxID=3133321 RepID=UPI003F5DC27F